MEVLTFDSFDEMEEAFKQHRQHAMEGLHIAQSNITYGDHWVRFVDLNAQPPIVEFGRVLTPTEIARQLMDDGTEWAEVRDFITMVESRLTQDGLLYGTAASLLEPRQTLGETHKAHVWPIEDRLYTWAMVRGWDITSESVSLVVDPDTVIDTDAARFLLEVAFRSMEAHVLGQGRS